MMSDFDQSMLRNRGGIRDMSTASAFSVITRFFAVLRRRIRLPDFVAAASDKLEWDHEQNEQNWQQLTERAHHFWAPLPAFSVGGAMYMNVVAEQFAALMIDGSIGLFFATKGFEFYVLYIHKPRQSPEI